MFHEHEVLPWRGVSSLVPASDRLWRLPDGHRRIPLSIGPLVGVGLAWIWPHCTTQRMHTLRGAMMDSMRSSQPRYAIEPRLRRLQLRARTAGGDTTASCADSRT